MNRLARLLVLALLFTCRPTLFAQAAPVRTARYVALVVVDGMRADYLNVFPTPSIHELMARGASWDGAWVGHVVNNTPPGHATISSGCFPRTHGIVDFIWTNSSGRVQNHTTLEAVIRGDLARMASARNTPSIAKLVKQSDPTARTATIGSHKYYAVGSLALDSSDCTILKAESRNIDVGIKDKPFECKEGRFIKGQRPPTDTLRTIRDSGGGGDKWSMEAAITVLKDLRPRALLVNLPNVDGAGHASGGIIDLPAMKRSVTMADHKIGELVQAYKDLGIYDETLFVVVGDHGMMLRESPISDEALARILKDNDVRQVAGAGSGTLWLSDASKSARVAEAIMSSKPRAASAGYFKTRIDGRYVYLPAAGQPTIRPTLAAAYDYLLSTVACESGPDVVICSKEMSIVPDEFPKKGKHYQISWGSQHIPIIFAGPGVRKGAVSMSAARLVDVAPTILALMGIEPKGMEGIVLADAMVHPRRFRQIAQQQMNQALKPLRNALRNQPRYDPTGLLTESDLKLDAGSE